jgi:hypothetical protein
VSWARIDDQMAFHAKILRAGNESVGAWVRMIAHSCAQLTDGFMARDVALTIAPQKVLDRLVSAGLLDPDGDDYRIHDFHDWNPPAAVVRSKREADKVRKSLGRSGQVRSVSGRMSSGRPSDVRADADRTAQGCPPVPSPVSRLPSPVPVQEREKEDLEIQRAATPPHACVSATSPVPLELVPSSVEPRAARRREPARAIPIGWSPSEETLAALAAEGVPSDIAIACLPEFADHWRGSGERKSDWEATFRNRVRYRRDRNFLPKAAKVEQEFVQETVHLGKRCLEVFLGDKVVRIEYPDGPPAGHEAIEWPDVQPDKLLVVQ